MEIINGQILDDSDKIIGTATKELKYGYHPAVKVTVGSHTKWFELDEPDLLAKIADFAKIKTHERR